MGGGKTKVNSDGTEISILGDDNLTPFYIDPTIDKNGNIYVTVSDTNIIYRINERNVEVWLESEEIFNPNGIIVDGDKFNESNLNRQLLSTEENIGKLKAKLAEYRSPKIYGGTGDVALWPPFSPEQ